MKALSDEKVVKVPLREKSCASCCVASHKHKRVYRISTFYQSNFFSQNAEMRVSLTIYLISCIKSTLMYLLLFKLYF